MARLLNRIAPDQQGGCRDLTCDACVTRGENLASKFRACAAHWAESFLSSHAQRLSPSHHLRTFMSVSNTDPDLPGKSLIVSRRDIRMLQCPLAFVNALMKACLSFTVSPTLLTLANLASASPTLSKTFLSVEVVLLGSSDSSNVSLLLNLSS